MKRRTALTLTVTLTLTFSGCGYFNSLYNARRDFSNAERQRMRGDLAAARAAYTASIEKAAKSYRHYPHGRWSNDALFLIARARFQLGESPAARAAFAELLSRSVDQNMRAAAHAFSGASAIGLGYTNDAALQLDSALLTLDSKSELYGFAHLWRARARADLGDVAGAWSDLDAVTSPNDEQFQAIQVERLTLSIASADTARARDAFARLLASHDVRRQMDTIATLAYAATGKFGAAPVRLMLGSEHGAWAPAARDSLALMRALIADRAGDTLSANTELLDLAGHASTATASAARVTLANARLRAATKLEQLADVRALLLPAISNVAAQNLIRTMRLVDVLVRRAAETGQPLALFAAAEIARDDLGAGSLARQLFITFADVGGQTPWAGKALLAALALAPNAPDANDLRARMAALPSNPYTSALRGDDAEAAYATAEDRLDRSLTALRSEASQLAQQQETGVTRMVFVLDSVKLAARTDTLRARCGVMVDTLALTGIRADSVRSVCVRGDTELLASYLKIDTLRWKPGGVPSDTVSTRKRTRTPTLKTDTIK